MLIDLTGIWNIREQDEVDIGIMQSVVVQRHIDDGIESLEQSTEVINSGNENIKERYMNNRDNENITGNINDNVSGGTNDNKLWNEQPICT